MVDQQIFLPSTSRLDIRWFAEEHAESDAYLRWLNDDLVVRYLGRPELMAQVDRSYAMSYYLSVKKDEDIFFFALFDRSSDVFIGTARLKNVSAYEKWDIVDIGIMVGERAFWGKGYGGEVIRALASFCFDVMNSRKVVGGCHAENSAMEAVFRKVGFELEGRLRDQLCVGGEFTDHLLFGYLKRDFRRSPYGRGA